MKKNLFFIVLFVSLTLSLFGTEIFVDGNNTQGPWYGTEEYPFQFIQDAIDIAEDWDIITVKDYDAYCENLQITNKSITLRSESGNPENCIIDGGNVGNVVDAYNSSSSDKFFNISGFTIKNSITSKGIYAHMGTNPLSDLNVEISKNIIKDSRCGIDLLRVSNCVIQDNTIINYSQVEPSWGIKSQLVNNVIIDGNFISNFWHNITFLLVVGKVINNKIEMGFYAEDQGIRLHSNSNIDIINNLLLIASYTPGGKIGIYNGISNNAKIINNTIIGFGDNTVGYKNFSSSTTEKFVNNIMWDLDHNIYAGLSVFEVNYCCYNGTIPPQCEPLENHNIIDDDPLFTPDYHLSENSPCIDTGDPDTDGDGENWFYDEDDRDLDGSRKDMGCYPFFHEYDLKHFHEGWNWMSFPVLRVELGEEFIYADDFLKDEESEPTIHLFHEIIGYRKIDNQWTDMSITYDYPIWLGFETFENKLYRHEGYKIDVTDDSGEDYLTVRGDRIHINYPFSFEAGIKQWVGYYLPYPQNIVDAFGIYFEDVHTVKAEDWLYHDEENPEKGDCSTEGKTMEYGKTYVVEMNIDIPAFYWYNSEVPEEPRERAESQYFSFNDKSDYEAIEVDSIAGIENVVEIGVFEDGTCVGAAVVETLPVQILAYTDLINRDGPILTFEVVTGRGMSQPVNSYSVLNLETGRYEVRPIISGRQEYSIVRLNVDDFEETPSVQKITLSKNYPNPFNPNTTILFSLPEEMKITLFIYNIKGQKVRTLCKGKAGSGQHTVIWNGKDNNEKPVSSGIYFYKLEADNRELTRKMLLLK